MSDSYDSIASFSRAYAEIAKAIAIDIYRREPIDEDLYKVAVKEAYDEMAKSFNGNVDLPASSIELAVHDEIERQQAFFNSIEDLSIPFGKAGIQFRVESLSTIRRDSFWNTGVEPQCTVRVGESYYLVAFVPCPARARITPDEKQGGTAATVIYASPHCILLLPGDETISGATGQACQKYLGEFKRVSFPFTKSAFTGPGFVNIDVDEPVSTAEMNVLFNDMSIHAAVINHFYNGLTTIHPRGEPELSLSSMRLHYWTFQAMLKKA